jgi:hypothetical protein
LEVSYVNGTKIESRANRYTFVRRKTVEKNAEINRENRTKAEQKEIKTPENKYLPKLAEYEQHFETVIPKQIRLQLLCT